MSDTKSRTTPPRPRPVRTWEGEDPPESGAEIGDQWVTPNGDIYQLLPDGWHRRLLGGAYEPQSGQET